MRINFGGTGSLVLVAVLVAAACDGSLPIAPHDAVEIPHDAFFYATWDKVESCSQLRRDPNRTRRFLAPGERIQMRNGETIAAYYDHRLDAIYVAEGLRNHEPILAHEILHVLLIKLRGERGHPAEYFVDRCGDLAGGSGAAEWRESMGIEPIRPD